MLSEINFDGKSWLAARRNAKEVDDKGNTLMTLRYLKQLCKEQKGYQTPELNDILYLHFKGFSKIENLNHYSGLKSLWLEGNGIGKIENLVGRSSRHLDYQALLIPAIDDLTNLKCLFLQQNCISIMENMDCLTDLDTLNLSNNLIKSIQGLSNLSKITTLTISHNFLQSADDIREMLNCPSLCVVDLSHNKIDDPQIVEVFENMPELSVLNLMGNPVTSKIPSYRKTIVSRCQNMKYLDDRPVFEKERLTTNAWAIGGIDGERAERERIRDAEIQKQNENFEAMRLLQEKGRQKRLENYGQEEEAKYSDKLEAFRETMLSKIEEIQDEENGGDLLDEVYEQQDLVQPSFIREIEEDENVDKNDVPELETPEVEGGDLPAVEQTTPKKKRPNHLYDAVLPESPSKLYSFNSKAPILASITETEECDDSSSSEQKYSTPTEQRKADLSLLDELVLIKSDSVEDMQVPLLDSVELADSRPSIVTRAWEEPVKDSSTESNDDERMVPIIEVVNDKNQLIETIVADGLSKQSTLVDFDQPKQAWSN